MTAAVKERAALDSRTDVSLLHGRDLSDIVANNRAFDAVWYAEHHAAGLSSGMTPERHFCLMAPFSLPAANASAQGAADAEAILASLTARKRVSFCIPVLNRLDDLEATLAENLHANRAFADRIEFIVSVLSPQDPALAWVRSRFAGDLDSGYLRLIQPLTLDHWHFGRAKNSFCGRLRGAFYSSLDGDNFLAAEEVEHTLAILDRGHPSVLIHHFSGTWGDGTSGRITVPRAVYETIGYDERLLWRQFDEMDLIFSAIRKLPGVHLYRRESDNHLYSEPETATFAEGLDFTLHLGAVGATSRAVNTKSADYVEQRPDMQALTRFNMYSSFEKNEPKHHRREIYRDLGRAAGFAYLEAAPDDRIAALLQPMDDTAPQPGSAEIALFACLKNDQQFLPAFYDHYRAQGVRQFFFIDDGSDLPGPQAFSRPGVHWFRPQFGWFGTSKVLWMKALMQRYLRPGAWALMVDADEFVDLPVGVASFPDLAALLEGQGANHAQGVLIDMVPGPGSLPDQVDFVASFDSFLTRPGPVNADYAADVAWAFGARPEISWAVDLRHHLMGTMDSLRKVPFVRFSRNMMFNQGFHNLTAEEGDTITWRIPTLPDSAAVLPIRHYKLAKFARPTVDKTGEARRAEGELAGYYYKTRENILKMIESGIMEKVSRLGEDALSAYHPQAFFRLLAGHKT